MTNVFLCFRSWRNSCSRESKQFLGGHSQPGHSSWFAIISDKFVVVVSACDVSDVRMMTGVCWWLVTDPLTSPGAGCYWWRCLARCLAGCLVRWRSWLGAHSAETPLPLLPPSPPPPPRPRRSRTFANNHRSANMSPGRGFRRVKWGPAVQFVSRRQWLNRGSVIVWVSREMTGPWHHDWSVCSVDGSFGAALMQHIFWRNSSLSTVAASPLPTAETVFTINTKSWKMK